MDFAIFFDLVAQYNNIALFVHEFPDGDASNSQAAMYQWLKERYPDKHLTAVTAEDDEIADNSLALVLDCANGERVLGKCFEKAVASLLIDHHFSRQYYTDYAIVDNSAAATCEVIGNILLSRQESLSKEVSQLLYCGLISDSLNFTIPNTGISTLALASKLVSFGVDIQAANEKVFSTNFNEFSLFNAIRQKAVLDEGLLVVKLTKEFVYSYGLKMNYAKESVREFQNINDAAVIALFYQAKDDLYNVSLRSAKVPLNALAEQYGGGGHRLACGIKDMDEASQARLINDLKDLIKRYSAEN